MVADDILEDKNVREACEVIELRDLEEDDIISISSGM